MNVALSKSSIYSKTTPGTPTYWNENVDLWWQFSKYMGHNPSLHLLHSLYSHLCSVTLFTWCSLFILTTNCILSLSEINDLWLTVTITIEIVVVLVKNWQITHWCMRDAIFRNLIAFIKQIQYLTKLILMNSKLIS